MKKTIILLLVLIICIFGFAGCNEPKGTDKDDYEIETPSDTINEEESCASDLGQDDQEEKEEDTEEINQEDSEEEQAGEIEIDKGTWSVDVQI